MWDIRNNFVKYRMISNVVYIYTYAYVGLNVSDHTSLFCYLYLPCHTNVSQLMPLFQSEMGAIHVIYAIMTQY